MQSLIVQDPWFREIVAGRKTVEGRTGPFNKFEDGDRLKFLCGNMEDYCIVEVRWTKHYATLWEYLEVEWDKAAPQCETLKKAWGAYAQIKLPDGTPVFNPWRVKDRGGIIALELRLLDVVLNPE